MARGRRRVCLDAVVLVVTALALWLTMVRQYGGLPPGTPVDLDGSDVAVFCAFFVNLVVLLALGRRFDPKRRFPHDSLAGLAVVRTAAADAGKGPAAGSGRGVSLLPSASCGPAGTRRRRRWPRRARGTAGGGVRTRRRRRRRPSGSGRGWGRCRG